MRITDFLPKGSVVVTELKGVTKQEVIQELADALLQRFPHLERTPLIRGVEERERLGSTSIGAGIAIPHGKLNGLCQMALCVGRSARGVDFESLDGGLVYYVFLLLAPDICGTLHLRMLAAMARLLKNDAIKKKLPLVKAERDVLDLLETEVPGDQATLGTYA